MYHGISMVTTLSPASTVQQSDLRQLFVQSRSLLGSFINSHSTLCALIAAKENQHNPSDLVLEAMNSPNLSSIPPEVYKQDRGPRLVIVIWVFAALALATVSIRLWARCNILHRLGLEDFLMFFAWVSMPNLQHSSQVLITARSFLSSMALS